MAAAAVRLDLDYVRYVEWREHEDFSDDAKRHAAELVAFDVSSLCCEAGATRPAPQSSLYGDAAFREAFESVFRGAPTGRMFHARLPDLARQVHSLEARVEALEQS